MRRAECGVLQAVAPRVRPAVRGCGGPAEARIRVRRAEVAVRMQVRRGGVPRLILRSIAVSQQRRGDGGRGGAAPPPPHTLHGDETLVLSGSAVFEGPCVGTLR